MPERKLKWGVSMHEQDPHRAQLKSAYIILLGLLSLLAWGCTVDEPPAGPNSAAAASSPSSAPAATHAAANKILSILTVEHEVDVRAQREGIIQQIRVDEGKHVQTGEILGELDARQLDTELEKARADLLVAQNNVKYKVAENQAKEANLKRQQLLRAAGLSSDADLEEAQFEAKATAYEVDSWTALVKSSQAQIASLQIEVEQTQFRAPFAGVILRRYVRQGQTVSKDDPCFRVSQLAPLQAHFQVSEMAGPKPAVGASVSIAPSAEPAHAYEAKVIKVSPTVDPSSDAYDVTAQLSGSNLENLSPGMAVLIDWPGPESSQAVQSPQNSSNSGKPTGKH
jgi:RND family efflux transporter MFP subunit